MNTQAQDGNTAGPTQLCLSLREDSCARMGAALAAAAGRGVRMVELRLDYLRGDGEAAGTLAAEAKKLGLQTIATCRPTDEGGVYQGDETQRIGLLEQAAAAGADYLDVEYAAWRRSADIRQKIGLLCPRHAADRPRAKLILSRHDLQRTPADLDALFTELAREPCHAIKLACRADTILDALRMVEALRNWAGKRPTIALCIGETGIITRVLANKFGAFLVYAVVDDEEQELASIDELRGLYRWDAVGADTGVYGVIGCPVGHSLSPAMHNAAFGRIGHNGVYLPLRVEPDYASFRAFADFCISRPWLGLRGCSVTIPHKENLLRYVQQRGGEIEPLARRIGAANTLSFEPGQRADGDDVKVSAYNTDYRGALDALCAGMGIRPENLKSLTVAVLGAGGVSRAVVAGLRDGGGRVVIYNRTYEKAAALAAEFGAEALANEKRLDNQADVVINCTSIGMWPAVEDTPLPAEGLRRRPVVFDTVYNPVETRLLREARQAGCRTVDGVAMFVNQAAAQFERWTVRPAPADLMRQVLLERLTFKHSGFEHEDGSSA